MNNIIQLLIDHNVIHDGKIRPRKLIYWIKDVNNLQILTTSTSFLSQSASPQERGYCIQEHIQTIQLCPICNNPVNFRNGSKGYRSACSHVCGKKLPSTQLKRAQTIFDKHGVSHYSKTEEFKVKYKQTSLARYGQPDAKMTSKSRTKARATMISKYGGQYTLSSPELVKKVKRTMIATYGEDHPMKVQSIKSRHSMSTVRNNSDHIDPTTHLLLSNYDWLYHQHITLQKSLPLIAFEQNVSPFLIWNNCNKAQLPINRYHTSSHERLVYEHISKYVSTSNIITNDREQLQGKELDIYIPTLNLAFEIHGLYWHNDDMPHITPIYHQQKAKLCFDNNIKLVSIFEDQLNNDWDTVKDIVHDAIEGKHDTPSQPILILNMQYMHYIDHCVNNGYNMNQIHYPTRYSIRNTQRHLDDDGPLYIHDCGHVTLINTEIQ